MSDLVNSFISKSFLRSVWALEYEAFKETDAEITLNERLKRWSSRKDLRETSAEAAFIQEFFSATWGYTQTGQSGAEDGTFTLWPKFSIAGAGEKGGKGEADLAIGFFEKDGKNPVPQILCEFKDIRSDLDAPQKRKGNNRSPVRQCLDYLSFARRGLFPTDPILPTWGIVTDMNEFRLYWFDRGHHQFLRFRITRTDLLHQEQDLLGDSEAARFERFLFWKVFHRDTLLSRHGRSDLAGLINKQRFKDRELENTFYSEYRAFRERLYMTLLAKNGEGTPRFPGTRGRLVRLAQKILDRFIFIFFCEDMGQALAFPPKLLQDILINRSTDIYFDENATNIWHDMLRLFKAMNDGSAFGGKAINQFNGGLFAPDEALEKLYVPNSVFCRQMQGANEASLYAYKDTLLYLCAAYNYASDLGGSQAASASDRDPSKSLGLYTLGRIFEQSITELEILEAEADGRPSINKESKRKRDGVYYTPEWVVERVVEETLGPRLAEIKKECGWPDDDQPTLEAIETYSAQLKSFTVLDPACGSGAFLITVLKYLVNAWREVEGLRRSLSKGLSTPDDDAELIADILRSNIYGVDINPASVEIARLALWLHTARGDKPLSSLDRNIRDGNSLIGNDFYKGQINLGFYNETEKERINAFDWEGAFPEVFARGGFDAIVGNPPYVKLQNFRTAHSDMAEFLKDGPQGLDTKPYTSTQTGNFDLYLPFIEKGICLLNPQGRLGYIAPSLWIMNEYGEGLREWIARGRHLHRWIDFKAYQVFEEATTYTALQFFTKAPNEAIEIAEAPAGEIPEAPWEKPDCALAYGRQVFGERWLLLTGEERALIDKLYKRCKRLDDPAHSSSIFVGIQTSADDIYHLTKKAPGLYICTPKGAGAPPPYEVEIEDELMKPLVSGAEAKRYVTPSTDTYLLFPYAQHEDEMQLIDAATMAARYPKGWAYLNSYRDELRLREAKRDRGGRVTNGPFDDDEWYRFGRHQNLDKQEITKLIVAQTVPNLRLCLDETASLYLNNVRVNGIIAAESENPSFLLGVLNAPVADFVFKRIAKVKDGGYFEANKQFIAPLPIPPASAKERAAVADGAKALQAAHTARRDILAKIERRLSTVRAAPKPETWLFPSLKSKQALAADAPRNLDAEKKRDWAKKQYDLKLDAELDAITARLRPGVQLSAAFDDGELSFSIDGAPIIERIFLDKAEGEFIVAQWKVLASTFSVTENTKGKKLADSLRKLAETDNKAIMEQVIALEGELSTLEVEIARKEAEINDLIARLYGLTEAEKALVQRG